MMSTEILDLRGLKCPLPTLQLTIKIPKVNKGVIMEVVADCDSFERDVREWCKRSGKTMLWLRHEPNKIKRCQIQT